MSDGAFPQEGDELPETWHFHPDSDLGPWAVILTWKVLAGRAECVGVEIYSAPTGRFADRGPARRRVSKATEADSDGVSMTTAAWRNIPIARFIASDRTALDDLFPGTPDLYQRGPRSSTIERAQEAADVYRNARQRSGWTHRPTAAVAAHFQISSSAAAKLVAKARELGHLPLTTPGVAVSDARSREDTQR